MRKLLTASILSCFLLVGCLDTEEAVMKAHPEGQFVIHRLSKRRGQIIGYGVGDNLKVRFVYQTVVSGPNGTVTSHDSFEEVMVRAFEIEAADEPKNQKGN